MKKPKNFKGKWRGIQTTSEEKNEVKAKTIKNRLKLLSISLPRIDDKKRWAGFPGLTGWANQIAKIIPDHDFYIEPFAGTAKVFQALIKLKSDHSGIVLNDKSDFIYDWLVTNFKNKALAVTNDDFIACIKLWDGKSSFFLFDQPWNKNFYLQNFSCFNRNSTSEYDSQILSLCSGIPFKDFNKERYKIEGDYFITTRKENRRMLNSTLNKIIIKSEYVVSGHYPELLISSNLKLKGNKP